MMDDSNNDPLVTILGQHKKLWNLERQNLSPQDRERLWNERVSQLNAVLKEDAPRTTMVPELSLSPAASALTHQLPSSSSAPQQASDPDSLGIQQALSGAVSARKRSDSMRAATERMSTASIASSPTIRKHENEDDDLTDDTYSTGNPPKMLRLPSGRKPVPHIKTQGLIGINHADAKSSMTGNGNPLNFTNAVGMPSPSLGSPLPSAASGSFSAASSQHHHLQGSLPADMSRQNSLASSFTSRVANMHIKSPAAEDGHLGGHNGQHGALPEVFEPDQDDQPLGDELGPSTAPIPIPSRRRAISIRSRRCSGASGSHMSRVSVPPPTISEQTSPTNASNGQSLIQQRLIAPRPSIGDDGSASGGGGGGGNISSSNSSNFLPQSMGKDVAKQAMPSSTLRDPQPVVVCYENGQRTEKIQIAKLEPPKKKKENRFFCEQCDKHPGGFRGAHELQRHFDAQHAAVKKAWVCIDGSAEGNKLRDCKWCMGQKTYPAYYNAAAHLRRIHFKPKTEGGKNSRAGRGGIGGGKYPPMDELKKYWMRQVELVDGQILDEDEIDDGEDEDPDFELVGADEIDNHNSSSTLVTVTHGRDDAQQVQSLSFVAGDPLVTSSDLTTQAALRAELALPYLSNTIDTMATSFCGDGLAEGADMGMFSIDPMSASQLLAAHPAASPTGTGAGGGATEMHQSFCSVDRTTSNIEPELSDSMEQLDFDVLFDDNDFPFMSMQQFGDGIDEI